MCNRQIAEVRDANVNPAFRMDILDGIAIRFTEGRPPGFVTPDDFIEALLKRADIQCPSDAVCDRNIVGRIAREHLIDDPHLMLSGRKWRGLSGWMSRNPARFGGSRRGALEAQFQQPLPFCGEGCRPIHRKVLRVARGSRTVQS